MYNLQAEQSVLGAILLDNELIKECNLATDDFSSNHKFIFESMKKLDAIGQPIDPITLLYQLPPNADISYISKLSSSVPTTKNFIHYCELVQKCSVQRGMRSIANQILDGAEQESTLSDSINELMKLAEENTDNDDGDVHNSLIELFEELEKSTGELKGIPSGLHDLDKMLRGFKEDDLIIVGARPSMGKTAFCLNLGANTPDDTITAVFSLEMGKKSLLRRCISFIGNVDQNKMDYAMRDFTSDDWVKVGMAISKIEDSNMKIFEKPSMDVNYIWNKVRKIQRDNPGKRVLVIIDYLQLIQGSKDYKGQRMQEISDISRSLKQMARTLHVPVMALSQLSRDVEKRQDKRPVMSDLRESGQIEQDADVIMFLYRDDYYNVESEKKNIVDVIISKHRNGKIGNVELAFLKEYGKFVNLNRSF